MAKISPGNFAGDFRCNVARFCAALDARCAARGKNVARSSSRGFIPLAESSARDKGKIHGISLRREEEEEAAEEEEDERE